MKQTLGHMVRLDSQGRDIQLRLHGIRPRVGNLSWLLGGGAAGLGALSRKGLVAWTMRGSANLVYRGPGESAQGKCQGIIRSPSLEQEGGHSQWAVSQ